MWEISALPKRYDNKDKSNLIIIFMSQNGIDWLRESTKNNSDGTFSRCPKLFYQFYVIFGQKNDYILPCVYCLLPNKTKHAIHGWICRHGYKRQYMNVSNFRIWVNMFGTLAFVPLNRLVEALNIIKSKIPRLWKCSMCKN